MAPDGRGRYSGERFASGIGAGAGRRLVDTALQLRVPLLPPDLAAIGPGGAPDFFTASSPAMADQPIPTSRRASSSRRV